jgi:hypothetical protein
MTVRMQTCRVIARRILGFVGVAAAGAGLASIANSQVFAHQFLQEMGPAPNLEMVYSPELQLMVKPGTTDPVYGKTQSGTFKVATNAVTQGSGPNGQGPHADSD